MGNLFDRKQKTLHRLINRHYGYMVSWTPADGGAVQLAKCLFQDPTKAYKLGEVEFSPDLFSIEYEYEDLPGLYESSMAGERERLKIYKIGEDLSTAVTYAVMKPLSIWDGKTRYLVIERL
jgi:hypothetical protein